MNHFLTKRSVLLVFQFQILLWLFLTVSFSAFSQTASSDNFLKSKDIRIKKSEMLSLFSAKAGENKNIHFVTSNGVQNLEIRVLNHQNMGENSGAIAAKMVLEKTDVRLLVNRKLRNGKLIYWIAIMPSQGEVAFKLNDESAEEFVLVQVSKNEVVTE
ncbi:MAG TPA: hypothetical protein PKY12_08950 [Catalimonadaceae bacterium]|nr:hypothetical protein [Catalimonadaceae bacterium]